MTVSGTTLFNPDFIEYIEEAGERAGVEVRNGYFLKTARRSINILFADWANRGINMWTSEERSEALLYNTGGYTLGTDIVDLTETMVEVAGNSTTTRYNVERISLPTFASRTNPDITGRPTEIYIDRQRDAPVIHIWPLPNATGTYTLVYWVLRRIYDAGAYTNTGDFPFRFIPPFISGLALLIAEKKSQDNPNLVLYLRQKYEEDWQRAADEDREKATLRIVPRGESYRMHR